MNLKVLHVVGGYPTAAKPHNQVFIKTQVDSLVRAGVDCQVLSLQGNGFRKYLLGRPQVRRELKAENFDLIHAHYSYCGLVALFHGLPVLTSFQGSDIYGFALSDGSYPFISRAAHLNFSRLVARFSGAAIVKAQKMRADLNLDLHVVPKGPPVTCSTRVDHLGPGAIQSEPDMVAREARRHAADGCLQQMRAG